MTPMIAAATTESPSTLGDQAALRILIRAVLADGVVFDSEMSKVREVAATGIGAQELVDAILSDEQESASDLADLSARIVDVETRASVFAACVAIMCSDAEIADSEREFMVALASHWSMPPERTNELLDTCLCVVLANR